MEIRLRTQAPLWKKNDGGEEVKSREWCAENQRKTEREKIEPSLVARQSRRLITVGEI